MLSGIYRINDVGDRPFLSDGIFIGNSPNFVDSSQDSSPRCSKVFYLSFNPFPGLGLSTIEPYEKIGTVCVGKISMISKISFKTYYLYCHSEQINFKIILLFSFVGDRMPHNPTSSILYGIFEKFQFQEKNVPKFELQIFVREKLQSKLLLINF
jgi:hypothetical protein